MDDAVRGLEELCQEQRLTLKELADKAALDIKRLQAIVEGRWTPSPQERDRIAAVFGLTREQIAFGHKNPITHVYGHGPQFGRSP
ncbi:MAG: helix-turn-helix domain-containing protein [Gemmataceae bacterium]